MNEAKPSKNARREAARQKAQEQRIRQQRKERRRRLVLQLVIGSGVVAIVAVITLVIVGFTRPSPAGPRNMANGGITISGASFSPVITPGDAAGSTSAPYTAKGGKILIQVYEDFGCPVCQEFEHANAEYITKLVKSGAADVQYHPVAILDRSFNGDRYSTRSANAAAVVANYSPAAYYRFHSILYQDDVQPEEGGPGLSDDRLIALAKQAGATDMSQIESGVRDGQFENWVEARTNEFTSNSGSLANVKFPSTRTLPGTPTVIVDGQYYNGDPVQSAPFQNFVLQVGAAYTASPQASPSPSSSARG